MDALGSLAEASLGEEEGYLLSLDYSLAFDRLDPKLVRLLFLQSGVPTGTCDVMSAVWEHQLRFLQYDNQSLPQGIRVSTSMPQGDAWSLVAMVLCLVGPSAQIQGQFPNCILKTFIDDRTVVAQSAQDVLSIQEAWAAWSRKLGMQENQDKIRYFHASAQGRRNLALAGAPEELICQDPCVLGVHLRGRQQRQNTPKEVQRLQTSCKLIRRCAMLPVSWQWRKRVVATQGLAKAVWGWVCRLPPKADREKINSAIRVALREGNNASVPLRAVLRGHSLDFDFRTLSASYSSAQKQAWKRQGSPCLWARRGWSQVLQASMAELGWTLMEPWSWAHERLGFNVTLGFQVTRQEYNRSMHMLRESWRHARFIKFMGENRRDSALCRASFAVYSEEGVARARRACNTFQRFQVLSGASLSPAARNRCDGPDPGVCSRCSEGPATMHHLLWQCRGLQGRPAVGDLPVLQARLGWPVGSVNDTAILEWHVKVRAQILADRYG